MPSLELSEAEPCDELRALSPPEGRPVTHYTMRNVM